MIAIFLVFRMIWCYFQTLLPLFKTWNLCLCFLQHIYFRLVTLFFPAQVFWLDDLPSFYVLHRKLIINVIFLVSSNWADFQKPHITIHQGDSLNQVCGKIAVHKCFDLILVHFEIISWFHAVCCMLYVIISLRYSSILSMWGFYLVGFKG